MIELFDFTACTQMEEQDYDALVQRMLVCSRAFGLSRPVQGAPFDDAAAQQDCFAAPAFKAAM